MYQVWILEDRESHAQELLALLERCPRRARLQLQCLSSPEQLRCRMEGGEKADILLCDIDLGGRDDGIRLVGERFPAGCGTQVIYVTGFVEFCTRVYETEHIYFLTKPVKEAELFAAMEQAVLRLDALVLRTLTLRSGGRICRIPVSGIDYVESDRRKVCVYAGGERVESYKTLTQLKPLLGDGFVHCHKSFLVNMARVRQLEPDMLLLENGEKIPVSRKLKKQTKEQFLQYLAQQL